MTAELDDRLLDRPAKCRPCGSTSYTARQLNLHPEQVCYFCFDGRRGIGRLPPLGSSSAIVPLL